MHDAEGMRLGHRFDRLKQVVDAISCRQSALLAELGGQIASVQELHHHVRCVSFPIADVEHAHHVLALDSRGRARLTTKPLGRLAPLDELGHQEFQSNALVELEVPRGDDDAHAPATDDSLHAVLARNDVVLFRKRKHRVGLS